METPMPLIDKILFPVDFSRSCVSVARYVEALAGQFEAEIMLLHVVGPGAGELTLPEELLPMRQAQLNAFLADELKYFSTQRVCVTGTEPAPEIVAAALRWRPDLVMMPTHGLGVFQRFFFGSVAANLLRDLDCPVWTSVHSEVALPLEDIHCRRILCALDLTARSPSVLAWAAALAAEYEAVLGIVHATAEMPLAYTSVSLEKDLTRSVSEQAKKEIESLQQTAGTAVRVFIDSGDPPTVIAGAAKEFNADLLVIGRHESGSGDAYAILRDSPCPVISI
jgi:nucleotide-binding universal stress UspA family protein